jgi:DNA-binding CsgD family transcriptional regulator
MGNDLLRVVEAAYEPAASERDWLEGVAHAALPCLDRGLGLNAYTYDARNPADFRILACVGVGGTPVGQAEIEAVVRACSPETTQKYYEPGPPATMNDLFPAVAEGNPSDVPRLVQNVARYGIADVIGVRGGDPSGRGCIITVPCPTKLRLSPALRRTLAQLGAHLAAGWRLQGPNRPEDSADAVLDDAGRVLEARRSEAAGEAQALGRFVKWRALARGALRKEDAEEALAIWKALVRGEWSLVDHVDTDGKRLVLARRNRPGVRDLAALTVREQQVAAYAALGHSHKLISYELGIGTSTVAEHLSAALRKLGLSDRLQLVQLFGARDDSVRALLNES